MKICIVVEGGIGQNLIATATIRGLKAKYPQSRIFVLASWPDIFLRNPHVTECARLGDDKAYQNYIKGADLFFHKNLYHEMTALYKNQHIIKTFCEMHDVDYDGQGITYSSTQEEQDKAKNFFVNFKTTKPKILIQPFSVGGDKNWLEPYTQELINNTNHLYQWIYINDSNSRWYPYNTFNLTGIAIRDLIPLVQFADGLVAIDSCLQHIAGGLFQKPSLMLLGRSKKELYAWPKTEVLEVPSSCPDFGCERPLPYQGDKCLHHACMYAISPKMVENKLLTLIQGA